MHISCWLNFVLIETGVCVYQSRGFQTVAVCNKSCACILNCRECFKWCVCVSKWCMYVPRVCCTKWGECTDTNYDPHTHHCLCTRTNYDIHTYFSFTHTTSIHTRRGIMTRTYHFHLHTPFNTHTHTNYDSHTPLFIYTPHFNTHTHTNYDSHNHFSFTRTTLIHTRRGLQTAFHM